MRMKGYCLRDRTVESDRNELSLRQEVGNKKAIDC
jgi:hypothetical protein